MDEVETGVRRERGRGGDGEGGGGGGEERGGSSAGAGGSTNFWEGAKYNRPSGQSPLSPLRQMGPPVDLAAMDPDEVKRRSKEVKESGDV
jgi:hypothetical protein